MKTTKKSKSKISIPSQKIAKETKMNELIEKNPKAVEILFDAGMHCIGCPMAMQETLEQGCLGHGMNKKEINKLVERLNSSEGK
jgi:hybrid cluster-associated redox disulfide protein